MTLVILFLSMGRVCVLEKSDMDNSGSIRSVAVGLVFLLVASVGAYSLLHPGRPIMVVGTTDVPVGDDAATRMTEGMRRFPCSHDVPSFVLKGAGAYVTDLSATVKVRDVLDTRTVKVRILSKEVGDKE
jgi:hypothetical protein